jgi:nickel/cobalt transporter (NicO) family protein
MVNEALQSGSIMTLVITAISLGFIHTIFGPDHYVPFVMMSKAQKWSRKKTALITFLCAIGHVATSIIIGLVLAGFGMAAASWGESKWALFQDFRGSLAAWLLMGLGAAYFTWGLVQAKRNKPHKHLHVHEDGAIHTHGHTHNNSHMHAHQTKEKQITPWILFTIFIFGPCESLIPLMLGAWAIAKGTGVIVVAAAFSITTIITILAAVGILLAGISLVPLGKLERYTHAMAGLSLVICGIAIQFLGL